MDPARTMRTSGDPPVVADDRLSALPDGLLHTIQSFLTARQAVQTSVLSRRWEDLWCSMPYLKIDGSEFHARGSEYSNGESDDEECAGFEDFVNTLLMFHTAATLDRLCIRVYCPQSKFVERWVRRGIKCCPKVVEIRSTNTFWRLPRLGSSFSRLNRLHLVGVVLDGTFSKHLRCGCPVLEDLELKGCKLDDTEIASCTLKNLLVQTDFGAIGGVLTIKAPSLVYLQLDITVDGSKFHGVVVNEMPSLVKATISLAASSYKIPKILCELLCSLINVRDLTLSYYWTLAILHGGSHTFPVFHNLRTLMLDWCDLRDNSEILRNFLNNAPILEKLTLHRCKLPEVSRKRKTRENPEGTSLECQDTPTFQCPNLKWTVINYKEDDVDRLFCLLLGIWRNLLKTTIVLNKLDSD